MSEKATIIQVSHDRLIGKKCLVDGDFAPHLCELIDKCDELGIEIYVTASHREGDQVLTGAIVSKAKKSCHYVGHAIDANFSLPDHWMNSKRMKKANSDDWPEAFTDLIDWIRAHPVLRWGGDFKDPDEVHIDSNLYHRDKELYQSKLNSLALSDGLV